MKSCANSNKDQQKIDDLIRGACEAEEEFELDELEEFAENFWKHPEGRTLKNEENL